MQAPIKFDELHQEQTPQKTTALAPLTEPIIEGEVTAIIESQEQPAPNRRPYYLIVVGTVLVCLLFTVLSLLVPQFNPSATVTIIPRQEHFSTTGTIQLRGRVLSALTLSQSITVAATGKRHQNATRAEGTITFYNGLFTSQTIGAGTILTGADGVEVIIDQAAVIPAGNPPVYGQVTVSAHALNAGASGNIAAFDVYTACCATSVLAKNTEAFTDGAEARDFMVVTRGDIDTAASTLKATLIKSEQAALSAQVNPNESLITPPCKQEIQSDHTVGDEAAQVQVTVSETCSGIAYPVTDLRQKAIQIIDQEAAKQFGTGYTLLGDVTDRLIHATITDQARGMVSMSVTLDATYVYRLSPGERTQITHLIAGKSPQQAVKALFQLAGIQAASINSNAATLPVNPGSITIVVVYRSA